MPLNWIWLTRFSLVISIRSSAAPPTSLFLSESLRLSSAVSSFIDAAVAVRRLEWRRREKNKYKYNDGNNKRWRGRWGSGFSVHGLIIKSALDCIVTSIWWQFSFLLVGSTLRLKDIALQALGSKHWREEGKEGVKKRREGRREGVMSGGRKREKKEWGGQLPSPMRASALADSLCAAVLSAVMDSSFFSYRSSNCIIERKGKG